MDIKIFVKDSTKEMDQIGTNSMDLILTSPPYWDIIDYDHPNQLGKGLTYKHFLKVIEKTLLECMRVLKEDSFIVLIVGDLRKSAKNNNNIYERPKIYPFHSDIIKYFNKMDFDFTHHFIWQKTSVKKGKKGKIVYGSVGKGPYKDFAAPPYLYNDLSFEHILVFRKPGLKKSRDFISALKDPYTRIPIENAKEWMNPIWKIDSLVNNKHPATFPKEIAHRLISLFSIKNDIILDPFCGTGTVIKEAIALQRKAIGFELNEKYLVDLSTEFNLIRVDDGYSSKFNE